jgi:hypothetical protein
LGGENFKKKNAIREKWTTEILFLK